MHSAQFSCNGKARAVTECDGGPAQCESQPPRQRRGETREIYAGHRRALAPAGATATIQPPFRVEASGSSESRGSPQCCLRAQHSPPREHATGVEEPLRTALALTTTATSRVRA